MTESLSSAWALLRSLKVLDFMRNRELPSAVIASIDTVIDAFEAGDRHERNRIICAVDKRFSFVFFMYAGMSAVESVRRNQPELVRRGLIALAIENLTYDWRDSIPQLAKLYHSAQKFSQIDAEELLGDVGRMSNAPFNEMLSSFAQRSEESKALEGFGLRETLPPSLFNYETMQHSFKRPHTLKTLLRRFGRMTGIKRRVG
jgi:hypothetical protein